MSDDTYDFLSDEEKAAIADDDKEEAITDKAEETAEKKEPEAKPEDDTEVKAEAKEEVADKTETKEEPAKTTKSAETVNPLFQLTGEAVNKENIEKALTALNGKLEDGDVTLQEYITERDNLTKQLFKLDMYEDINKQVQKATYDNLWKSAQSRFFRENPEFKANEDLNYAFVGRVNKMLNDPAYASMDNDDFLYQAKEIVEKSLGRSQKPNMTNVKDIDEARKKIETIKKDEAKKGKDIQTLGGLPKAGDADISSRFDALDKLDGEDLENAVAALSDQERKMYARR